MKRVVTALILGLLSFNALAKINTISVQQVHSAISANANALGTIIDVRTPKEFAAGHVPGAINIPHDEIEQYLAQLTPLTEQGLVLYCRSGYRAGKALRKLEKAGLSNLTHMDGDMKGWLSAGFKTSPR